MVDSNEDGKTSHDVRPLSLVVRRLSKLIVYARVEQSNKYCVWEETECRMIGFIRSPILKVQSNQQPPV